MDKPIGRRMEGKVVTVINRSEIVGRPLAAMLSNDGATVYSVDINSIYRFEPGGRLEKCEGETPESCVRKVRRSTLPIFLQWFISHIGPCCCFCYVFSLELTHRSGSHR